MELLADLITALAALIGVLTPLVLRRPRVNVPDDLAPLPTDYRPISPPRSVLVQHDDCEWYPGTQDAWIGWPDGGWRASVEYTVAPCSKYRRSVPAERMRLP